VRGSTRDLEASDDYRTSALVQRTIQLAQLRVSPASMAMLKVCHWSQRYELIHMLPNEPQAT
jgi:hypothetical protein